MHLDPLIAAWTNKTEFGKVSERAAGWQNIVDRLDYVLYLTMEPGALNKMDRLIRAERGEPRYGRQFSLEEEVRRLLGVRQNTYTHRKRIESRLFRFDDEYKSAAKFARQKHSERPGSDMAQSGLEEANQRIRQLQIDWEQFQSDLKVIGIPSNQFEQIRKATKTPREFPLLILGENGPESERARTPKAYRADAPDPDPERARGIVKPR